MFLHTSTFKDSFLFLSMCLCVVMYTACMQVPRENREQRIPWDWNYRQLWATWRRCGKQAEVFYKSSRHANYSAISQISPQIRCFRTWLVHLLAQTVDILIKFWHQIMLLELCDLRLCVHNYSGKACSGVHTEFLLQITGFQRHWQAFSIVLSFPHPSVDLSHQGIRDSLPSAPKQACQGWSGR